MTPDSTHPSEKNRILREALHALRDRFPNSAWMAADAPFEALRAECIVLATETAFVADLKRYLAARTIVRRAISTFFAQIAMAARARPADVPVEHRSTVARGWFIGRWLPTFLVIDGPIGRFFMHDSSPLARRLGADLPVLSAARDMIADKTFRTLRNGFAHWGFDWEVVGKESYIVAYDWERDLPSAKIHLSEADAYHICAFALIEVVEDVLIAERAFEARPGSPGEDRDY